MTPFRSSATKLAIEKEEEPLDETRHEEEEEGNTDAQGDAGAAVVGRSGLGGHSGRQEGELQGRARAILEAFETLQIVVPSDIRERILGCTDIELLKKWARRALVAKSAAEIFDV